MKTLAEFKRTIKVGDKVEVVNYLIADTPVERTIAAIHTNHITMKELATDNYVQNELKHGRKVAKDTDGNYYRLIQLDYQKARDTKISGNRMDLLTYLEDGFIHPVGKEEGVVWYSLTIK